MLSKLWSMAIVGIDGVLIEIEIDISNRLPRFDIVGLPDPAIRESKYRVRTAILNSGYEFPYARILINLAPANIKKQGPRYDLPIALGLLIATGQIPSTGLNDTLVIGELALDGSVRPVPGILSMALAAHSAGLRKVICARENANEAAVVEDLDIYSLTTLKQTNNLFAHRVHNAKTHAKQSYEVDYSEVVGQEMVKRAVLIAAAGKHHFLLYGSPGCGKSMIAKRLPTILPLLSRKETMEATQIHSVANLTNGQLLTVPPYRAPHHTISNVALVGGGSYPQPGEISLAHNGILFLDELPEFSRKTLDMLRQPLEDGSVMISRSQYKVAFPCGFMLVAAMNPCPCGFYGSEDKNCRCSLTMVEKYQKRISGPMLDRFDLHVGIRRVPHICSSKIIGMSSQQMRDIVVKVRSIQDKRFQAHGFNVNSQIPSSLLEQFCILDTESEDLLRKVDAKSSLSARSYQKILKVSRTIADLEEHENIMRQHIAEALQYRSLENDSLFTS